MAPTVETHVEKKKSGIRRLLSPVIFSGEAHRRKEPSPDSKIAKLTKHGGEVKETAFIGTSQIPRTKLTRKTRSQSLSPVRYGSSRPKGEGGGANAATKNVNTNCYALQGIPKTTLERRNDRQSDANRNYSLNTLQQMKMQQSNNNVNESGSSFSSVSSSPTLAYSRNTNIRRGSNASAENVSTYSTDSNASGDRSGRTSAPPLVPYSQYYNRNDHKYMYQLQSSQQRNGLVDVSRYGFQQPRNGRPKEMSEKDYVIKKRVSPIMFCRRETLPADRKTTAASSNIPMSRTILRPQPLYCNTAAAAAAAATDGTLPRPRSVSPISANAKENNFVRGSSQRSTISGYYPRQSIIYEEENKEAKLKKNVVSSSPVAKSTPIFKRGTLVASDESSTNGNVSKKVSFSPSQDSEASEPIYWPTRNGLAVEPPTRQSARRDLPTANVYANLPASLNRPLPTVPNCYSGYGTVNKVYRPTLTSKTTKMLINKWHQQSESESGSEAGEVQRIFQNGEMKEEEWIAEAKAKGHTVADQNGGVRADEEVRRNRGNRREDPRRHTLSGDHHLSMNYQNNGIPRSMDLESPLSRGYPPPSNSMLFDDDPGIMSEVETSSTGFRRGNKQRSSLPVVRTPSKTLERPLGLVFLQYRNETKRSLLPNEITSIDTVKALFVRSFKQLTMSYLENPRVKIYIHDSSKDMFYELEDLRSHLNEIRDRTVLRLFESADADGGNIPSGLNMPAQLWNDQDQSYFSEPEFDSEYQHQHIHKTKGNKSSLVHQPYYMTHSFPPGSSATLPRGGSLLRPFSPAIPVASKTHSGYMSSPERAAAPPRGYSPYGRNIYEDPYYSQYGSRPSSITPIIDEETNDPELLEDGYNLYSGVKLPTGAPPSRSPAYGLTTTASVPPFDTTRLRVEHMERQLANLTGLVQKALTQTVPTSSPRERDLSVSSDKSVSFEKSVSFSDDPPEMNSPKQHSPQHTERERLKPVPPTKPLTLSTSQYDGRNIYRDLQLTPELYNQLRGLQKKAKDLRQEMRSLRRMSQAQAHTVRETVRDTYIKIRAMVLHGGETLWAGGAETERVKLNREEDIYKQEMITLEDDLTELESTVEELRSNVINRKTRVNMSDVENMALILSKSSKTVAELKVKFPLIQGAMKSVMTVEMERVVAEENFLKEEPERLESALRRCKKLTGTLVTLKRLASVQEQRLPDNRLSPTTDEAPVTPTSGKTNGTGYVVGAAAGSVGPGGQSDVDGSRTSTQNAIDSLLDELQTAKSAVSAVTANGGVGGAATTTHQHQQHHHHHHQRLHSHQSSDSKPPVPERHPELSGKRIPPPPPPRTSSKSPLASPTNPNAPARLQIGSPPRKGSLGSLTKILKDKLEQPSASTSSSCESINSQEGIQQSHSRHEQLEQRHQELLRKQKALQEQYTRLQQLQKTPPPDLLQLKKTGSESNILGKIGLGLSTTPISNSLSQLGPQQQQPSNAEKMETAANSSKTKIYETDIL